MFTSTVPRLTARDWHLLTERAVSLPYDQRSTEVELDTCGVRLTPLIDAATAGGMMLGRIDRFAILAWPRPRAQRSALLIGEVIPEGFAPSEPPTIHGADEWVGGAR